MSARLLKRLLQDTAGEDLSESALQEAKEKQKKAAQRRKNDFSPTADHDEVIQHHIQGMLFLDQKMASTSERVGESLARINKKHNKESRARKKSAGLVLGNSRDASSKMKPKRERSFSKSKHRAQKEKQKLQRIARLLNKNAAKSASAKK